MKKINTWFTFIEILVALWVLWLVGVFSLSSMNRNFEKQTFSENLWVFWEKIWSLERDLGRKYTDYTLFLYPGKNYVYSTQESFATLPQTLLLSWSTAYFSTASWAKVDIFQDERKITTLSGSNTFELSILELWEYTFSSTQTGQTFWTFVIWFYDSSVWDALFVPEKNGYGSWVMIQNKIGQKRQIQTFWWDLLSSNIEISFENKNWVSASLTLQP